MSRTRLAHSLIGCYSPQPSLEHGISSNSEPTARIPRYSRIAMVLAGSVLVGLLGVAAWLEPADAGFGTHQQLGLPPCTFKTLVGFRCPSCGMTTAWAHLMHGQIMESLRANSGGTVLAVLALVLGPWAVASGVRGRCIGRAPSEGLVLTIVAVAIGITLLDWSIRWFTSR